jgi:hypothetical protein
MAFLWFIVRRQDSPGPTVVVNCPRCGARGAVGESFERLETLLLNDEFPLMRARNTFVRCGGCSATLASRLRIGELEKYRGTEVSQFLYAGPSLVFKFLAIVSLLLFFTPGLGLVLSAITVAGTFKSRGWPRTVGRISLGLSILVTIAIVIGLIFGR